MEALHTGDDNGLPGHGSAGPSGRQSMPGVIDALLTVGLGALAAVVIAALAGAALDLSPAFWIRAGVFAFVSGAVTFWFVVTRLAPAAFGPANRLTSLRATGVALIAAFVGERGTPLVAWSIVAFAIVLLVLDGVDGRLARRGGHASAFGARFDMETDAALTLVLALLCWTFDKAGIWILAVGLMRYAFVAASLVAPWIGRPLPYSRRRQTVCVLQLSGLLAVLSPLFPVPVSSVLGIVTLALLAGSFAVDVDWLARQHLRHG